MLYLFIKKVTSSFFKIIAQFRCCQYVVKFLKILFSIQCQILKIAFSVHTNLDFVHQTHVKVPVQLLAIVHDICASFDQSRSLEVTANFLDISKALDKVWHEGLIFKLEHIAISGNLLSLLKSFLINRFQRVVLNDQIFIWSSVLAVFDRVQFQDHCFFLYT